MPGSATAQLLSYANIVDVALDQTNDVNLADVEDYGHRVLIEMNKAAMDGYFRWARASGSARPVAALDADKEAAFKAALVAALRTTYVDIDGVTNGLHFGSANLSTNPDPRLRKDDQITVNDLPLAYILYKLYGESNAATLDTIYNLEDTYYMVSDSSVATAITESLKAQVSGSVDAMFRDLLAADPSRFFDEAGVPVPGIFETNADAAGSGSWKLTTDDTVQIKLKFAFQSKVTRRGVAGAALNLAEAQTLIEPGDYFYVRLQLKASAAAPAGDAVSEPTGFVFREKFTGTNVNNMANYNAINLITNTPSGSGYAYTIPDNANLDITVDSITTNTITYCASLYFTGASAGQYGGIIFTRPNATGPFMYGNELRYDWNDIGRNNMSTGIIIPTNTWTHVVVAISASDIKYYVNGALTRTYAMGHTAVSFSKFTVGKDTAVSDRYFRGALDNLVVYNRTLTDAEVSQVYNASKA
jgi:hypothetical protein